MLQISGAKNGRATCVAMMEREEGIRRGADQSVKGKERVTNR